MTSLLRRFASPGDEAGSLIGSGARRCVLVSLFILSLSVVFSALVGRVFVLQLARLSLDPSHPLNPVTGIVSAAGTNLVAVGSFFSLIFLSLLYYPPFREPFAHLLHMALSSSRPLVFSRLSLYFALVAILGEGLRRITWPIMFEEGADGSTSRVLFVVYYSAQTYILAAGALLLAVSCPRFWIAFIGWVGLHGVLVVFDLAFPYAHLTEVGLDPEVGLVLKVLLIGAVVYISYVRLARSP